MVPLYLVQLLPRKPWNCLRPGHLVPTLSTSEWAPTFSCPEKPQSSVWSSRKDSSLHLETFLHPWTTVGGTPDAPVAVVVWNRNSLQPWHGWEFKDPAQDVPSLPIPKPKPEHWWNPLLLIVRGLIPEDHDPEDLITGQRKTFKFKGASQGRTDQ